MRLSDTQMTDKTLWVCLWMFPKWLVVRSADREWTKAQAEQKSRGRVSSLPLCKLGHLPLSMFSEWALWFSASRIRLNYTTRFPALCLADDILWDFSASKTIWVNSQNCPPLMCTDTHFLLALWHRGDRAHRETEASKLREGDICLAEKR